MEINTYQYEHQAMATYFKLVIANEEEDYAINAADQVFHLIDDMEMKLSRFIPDSEISMINRMKADDQLMLDFETWDVLKKAFHANQLSQGTFDIGVAKHMDIFRASKQGILTEFEMHNAFKKVQVQKEESTFYLDPDQPLIICGKPGMTFDLGGIGKGYVLDLVNTHLKDMGIETFSVSAGDSTLMLSNNEDILPYWKYPISAKLEQRILKLKNMTISASGSYHQGRHIFDPRTGENDFAAQYDMVWIAAKTASLSDALSTAAYLLSKEEMETIISESEEILWMAFAKEGNLQIVGENDLY